MLNALFSDAKIFLTLILIGLIITFTDSKGFLNLPKSGLQVITAPIQLGLYKTSNAFTNQFKFITFARQASLENNALREQMATVLSENADLRRRLGEAESFSEQSKSLDPQNFTLVATRPLGISRYLLIDKGSEDGFKVSESVVFKDSFIGCEIIHERAFRCENRSF